MQKQGQRTSRFSRKKLESPGSLNNTMKRETASNKDIAKSQAGPSIPLSDFFTFKKEKFHRIDACRNSVGENNQNSKIPSLRDSKDSYYAGKMKERNLMA